jgi:hypothetical protein
MQGMEFGVGQVPGKKGFNPICTKVQSRGEKDPKDPKDPAISSAHPNILGKSECEERDWPRPPRNDFASIILGFVERRYWSRSVYRSDLSQPASSPGMKYPAKRSTARRDISE